MPEGILKNFDISGKIKDILNNHSIKMPEEFEYFAQKEEEKPKKVSPKKEQEAIEYAQELKAIKDKESPTEEDVKRAKELKRKIERIYSKETLTKILERGSILEFIKKLEEETHQKIEDASYIHSQPDGTLAGQVQLEDGRWVPFQGDKLLETIEEKKIKYASNIHSQPDGTLAGQVQLEDGRWVNFFWDGTELKITKKYQY